MPQNERFPKSNPYWGTMVVSWFSCVSITKLSDLCLLKLLLHLACLAQSRPELRFVPFPFPYMLAERSCLYRDPLFTEDVDATYYIENMNLVISSKTTTTPSAISPAPSLVFSAALVSLSFRQSAQRQAKISKQETSPDSGRLANCL